MPNSNIRAQSFVQMKGSLTNGSLAAQKLVDKLAARSTVQSALQFTIAMAAVGLTAWSAVADAAEPAQIPLSSRVAEPPIPNVTLTIDDSGSMLADFMPEGNLTINTKTIVLGNDWIAAFPGDWRKLCQNGKKGCVTGTWPTGSYLEGVVTSIKNPTEVYQMQYRSPDVNAIYYNPDILYLPWYKPDGTRFGNSTPTAAKYDPVITDGTFNLAINYTKNSGADAKINTTWYTKYNATSASTQEFYPGYVYRLKAGADPTVKANYTLYDINATDGSHAPATKAPARTDCKLTKCSQVEELQNFANWFTYYRMRESLTKAAVSESFVQFKDKLRVSWGRINNTTKLNIDGSANKYSVVETEDNGGPLRPLDATRLNKVLTGVHKVSSWPSTPLRTALSMVGTYFDRSSDPNGSPWLTDPTKGSPNKEKLSCRRSVSLLMTDGYYNDSYTGAGDVDGVKGPDYAISNPNSYSPTQYKPVRPFIDAPTALSNTLADVAMQTFVKDLDDKLDNKVPPLTGDIAYWQHVTQFMVGLGVTGTLDSSTPARKTATLKAISDGTKNWPDPAGGNPQKIDDMWHAAVNTGGDFYSVRNVTELTAALKDAFGRSAGNEAKEAGVATASGYIVSGNVKYVPKYKSVSWWGDLEAWPLSIDGREGDTVLWRASEHLPAADSRNLVTFGKAAPTAFAWDKMDADTQTLVGSKGLTNYIRGDDTDTGYAGTYRSRDGKFLGDFVNSPPVLVRGLVDLGYNVFDKNYTTFVANKKSRPDGIVVVGGNDGMLHFFRSSDGTEVFGYLPREGLSRLKTIAAKDYGTSASYHRFFVDGPVNETDAYIKPRGASTAEWSNLVIGSMGAGGKTFFALHVPTTFGATLEAADLTSDAVMWETSGATDPDVGYMFADFAVGRLKNGAWKAFVGNGVYSTNGKAVLLVVNLETGAIEQRIVVDSSSGTGLMGVTLIKDDTTHEVVGAYAGDLRGNMWRFDVDGATVKVGYSGKPLFKATYGTKAQPITIAPSYVTHPEYGRVVLFGTGRLIDSVDADSTDVQTFYGVWDQVKVGETSVNAISPFESIDPDRSKLQGQEASTTPVDKAGKYFGVTSKAVDWKSLYGWYMDLPFSRQRVLFPSFILADTYVFFSTSVPATEAAVCSTSTGVGYNYLLSAAEGLPQETPTFDTDGDGDIDDKDVIAAGFKTGNDGRDAIIMKGNDEQTGPECVNGYRKYLDCHTGKNCEWLQVACNSSTVLMKDRIWKQIQNPPTPK